MAFDALYPKLLSTLYVSSEVQEAVLWIAVRIALVYRMHITVKFPKLNERYTCMSIDHHKFSLISLKKIILITVIQIK